MDREHVESALRQMHIQPVGFNGEWVQAACPFAGTKHPRGSDRKPSFGVSVSSPSVYYCFTCHSKGALSTLPRALGRQLSDTIDGVDPEALSREFLIAEATGAVITPESYEIFEAVAPLPEEVYGNLFLPVTGGPALNYATKRGLRLDTLAALGIMDWPEESRLMFPVRGFNGSLYGWSGRSYLADVKAKVWHTPGLDKKCHLLGAEHAHRDRPMVLVEGNMGYARFHDIGVPDELGVDVCAIMGSVVSEEQADMLAEIGQRVILFLDGDKAGRLGTFGDEKKEGSVQMLGRAMPVATVDYPRGIQDPDDLSPEQVFSMIENATPYIRKRVRARA